MSLATRAPSSATIEASQADANGSTRWTVLCVDDEPNILAALQRVLRGSGYRVLVAPGGDEALAILARESVQLVISDMRMPGIDGARLLGQVRQRWPAVMRILLTGHADVAATIAPINVGEIFRHIAKPWHEQDLLGAAHEAFVRQDLLNERARLERLVAAQCAELVEFQAGLEQPIAARTAELTEANARLPRNHLHSIKSFSNLIELRGGAIAGHSRRVADLARRIALAIGLPPAEVQDIFVAGLPHDIGEVGLPDTVLACPVPRMSAEERALHTRHAALGEQALLALARVRRAHACARLIRRIGAHAERHGLTPVIAVHAAGAAPPAAESAALVPFRSIS